MLPPYGIPIYKDINLLESAQRKPLVSLKGIIIPPQVLPICYKTWDYMS